MPGTAVEIVRASAVDIPFIMATERLPGNEGLVGRWERAEHEQALADASNAYFVGVAGGKPVGFVIVQHWASNNRAALIRRIIVADTGKKIGRALLSLVIDTIFRETDAFWVWLNVRAHNTRAQASYRALGFRFEDSGNFPAAAESKMPVMVLQRSDWRGQMPR